MYYWVECLKDSQILKSSPKENADAHIIGEANWHRKWEKVVIHYIFNQDV